MPGLIAFGGLDAYELADRFPGMRDARFCSSDRWAWLRFDPDEPGMPRELTREQLRGLRRPALVILARPHDRWQLSLHPRKGEALHATFHHELYRPATSPPGPRAKLPAEQILAELDASVPGPFRAPEEVLAKVRGKSGAKGLDAIRKAQARRVADRIEGLDLPADGDEVRRILSGEACSAEELLGPYGALPKFLDALCLGKALADEDGPWSIGPTAESLGSFDRSRAPAEAAPHAGPIAGGPVELPASDLALLWLLSWFCETDSEIDIAITPPPGVRIPLPRPAHWVTIHHRPGRVYAEIAWHPPGPRYSAYRKLAKAIEPAPAGTTVEFISGNTTEEDEDSDSNDSLLEAGSQRHLGTLTGRGRFLLTHSSIPGKPGDFLAAMEICRKIGEPKSSYAMASEQEARDVVEMARKTDWFDGGKALPRVKGASIVPANKEHAMATAMLVFRHRFAAGPWNTGAAQARDEASQRDWDEAIEQVGQKVGAALAAPSDGDVILRTDRAVYRRADWSKMDVGILDAVAFLWGRSIGEDEPPPETPLDKLAPVDQKFTEMGFTALGDIHVDRFGELYLRGYAGPAGDTYGCVMAGTFGQFQFEFVSHFSNKATLTTSNTPGLADKKGKRIYKRSFPNLQPPSLYKKHRSGLAELTTEKARPLPIDATIEGFCLAIDDYIKREM